MAMKATFPKAARVRSKHDFERARKVARAVSDGVLRISILPNGSGLTRLGLAVAKRGSAIERNRIKRVIREVFRLRRAALPAGFDLVVSPKDYAAASGFEAVSKSFDGLIARIWPGDRR